jgi:hypothetical protein
MSGFSIESRVPDLTTVPNLFPEDDRAEALPLEHPGSKPCDTRYFKRAWVAYSL